MLKLQGGDPDAFEQFYAEKSPHLFRIITWKTEPNLDALEVQGIVNQVINLVFSKAASYRGQTDGEAWGWISTISRNHMIDVLRQKKAYEQHHVELNDKICSNEINNIDENAIADKNWLDKFLPSLSPREQLLLKLLGEDVSQKDIASQLDVCLPRITQIKKAIQKKAQKFGK